MTATIHLLTTDNAPVAPSGFRTITFWWKTSKKTGKMLSPKRYSHVPVLSLPVMDDKSQMALFIRNSVENAQDDYLKGLIEDWINNGQTVSQFSDQQLNLSAVMDDFFSARKTGGRLNGDDIEEWFISDMAETLMLAIQKKLPEKNDEEIAKIMENYRDKYKKLASGAVKYPVPVAENLLKNINGVELDSVIKGKLVKRLETMTVEATPETEGLI